MIKQGDEVVVIAGVDVGKTGTVLLVDKASGRAIVEGMNLKKKTVRRTSDTKSGIVDREAPIALSNLMPYDPTAKKGARVRCTKEDDSACRRSAASSHVFD